MVKLGPVISQAPVAERVLDKVVRDEKADTAPSGDKITLSDEAKKRLLMGQIMARLTSHETAKKG